MMRRAVALLALACANALYEDDEHVTQFTDPAALQEAVLDDDACARRAVVSRSRRRRGIGRGARRAGSGPRSFSAAAATVNIHVAAAAATAVNIHVAAAAVPRPVYECVRGEFSPRRVPLLSISRASTHAHLARTHTKGGEPRHRRSVWVIHFYHGDADKDGQSPAVADAFGETTAELLDGLGVKAGCVDVADQGMQKLLQRLSIVGVPSFIGFGAEKAKNPYTFAARIRRVAATPRPRPWIFPRRPAAPRLRRG